MQTFKRYETDVLVVGGGGAATAATIAAHEKGARTMLAVKGRFGIPGVRGAGATSNPIGDFWTIRTVGPKGSFFNPPDAVLADMLQSGLGMADPALCRIFVDEVSGAVQRLQTMGMQFQSRMLATMEADASELKTNRIVAIQKAIIEETNTQVLEQANLTDLVVESGRCRGAVGVNDLGEPFVVDAKAVILATGGCGQLFKYSFNPVGNTGDGYAMASRAGAPLFNMEFMQQGLATTWPEQAIVMLYDMEEPYRLINSRGESFLKNYFTDGDSVLQACKEKAAHWPVSCRDSSLGIDRAIKNEVMEGRGSENDAVFLDLANAARGFKPELFESFMQSRGMDINNDLIQVQIHHHSSNGGIRIDENSQSKLPGLYAVGEVSGWQGADRLGGTMLGGSQVFGWRAGHHAGESASELSDLQVSEDACRELMKDLEKLGNGEKSTSIDELRANLQDMMWRLLIVEKNEDTLREAMNYIEADRRRLFDELAILKPLDYALAYEQRNLQDVAEVIISAGLARKESRGPHYRNDYPDRDDENYMANMFAHFEAGELKLEKQWINENIGWTDQPGDIRISPWG